jgi:hypothetical protein
MSAPRRSAHPSRPHGKRKRSKPSPLPHVLGTIISLFVVLNGLLVVTLTPQLCPGHACDSLHNKIAANLQGGSPVSLQSPANVTPLSMYAGGTASLPNRLNLVSIATASIAWTVKTSLPWVSISPASGTAQPGGTIQLAVTLMPAATLKPSMYQAIFYITSSKGNSSLTLPVEITTPAKLSPQNASVKVTACGKAVTDTLTNSGGWPVSGLAATASDDGALKVALDANAIAPGKTATLSVTLNCGSATTMTYAVYLVSQTGSMTIPVTTH